MTNPNPTPPLDERALDALLSQAAADARDASAPDGFADRVMGTIASEESLLLEKRAGGASAGSRGGSFGKLLGVCGAVAVVLIIAFKLGNEFGRSGGGDAGSKENAGENIKPSKFDNIKNDRVTVEDLKNDLQAGSGNGNNKNSPNHSSAKVGGDKGRPGQTSPSTIAGRFPRSADRRVYVVIDAKDGGPELASAKGFATDWQPPVVKDYNPHLFKLPVADAEKLLHSLDEKFKGSARAHLAGFSDTLLPVNDVLVTPPRADYTEPTPPAAGDDSIEIVIYTQK
ncbi:MAG: hypothetical protein HY286_15725 [Planctomycetes bacterium]|nr:hypothetical protein [Planctomycetota bacterium]